MGSRRTLFGLAILLTLLITGCRGADPASAPATPPAFEALGALAYLHDGGLTLLDGESNTTREAAGVGQIGWWSHRFAWHRPR
ncbi:MAG: hypothetical protein ACOY94_10340 [Bacillota bacterium]